MSPSMTQTWRGSVATIALLGLGGCSSVPRIDVSASGRETTEGGGSVALRVHLQTRPSGPLEVYAVSSNPSEARVSSALVFSPARYREDGTITITGLDDARADGDIAYDVRVFARPTQPSSAQPELIVTFQLTNRDDERAMFEALGDLPGGERASYAFDVSAAGDVVVGASADATGERAVRYAHGALAALPGAAARAYGVSPDGALVTGRAHDAAVDHALYGDAVLWKDDVLVPLGGAPFYSPGIPVYLMGEGRAVTDDGLVVGTCTQNMGYGDPFGCRARSGEALTVGVGGHLYATDGLHVAGDGVPERHAPARTWPTFDEVELGYVPGAVCTITSGCLGAVRDFALGGAVRVGTSSVPGPSGLHEVAFAFTVDGGVQALADLPGGDDASGAYAVSADGQLIAGFCSDERGRVACVWRAGAPRALEDALLSADGAIPEGYVFSEVTAVSADGRVLVGNGSDADGVPEAFRVRLPAAE